MIATERVAACPICDESARELLYQGLTDRVYRTPGSWNLQRCRGCAAVYLDPRPTRESIAAAYASYYTHEPAPWTPSATALGRLRRALRNGYLNARYGYRLAPSTRFGRVLVPLLPRKRAAADRHVRRLERRREGARVLDVGCGNGEFLVELRAAGWVVQGVETDPEAVAQARARGLDVREGSLEHGGFPARSFDAITLSHVLEHLHDPVDALRSCRRLLRDDGVLWLATPNIASLGHARFGSDWRGLEPPRHLVLFTPDALTLALARAGFPLVSFERPASARWVYEASERLAGRSGRAAATLADLRSARAHERGEELVALARPA